MWRKNILSEISTLVCEQSINVWLNRIGARIIQRTDLSNPAAAPPRISQVEFPPKYIIQLRIFGFFRSLIFFCAMTNSPPPSSTTRGDTWMNYRPSAPRPTTAVRMPFMALRPSTHSACKMMAITTGLTTYKSHSTWGVEPNWT